MQSLAALSGRVNAGTVGVISGGLDGTYARIAADLAAVLDDGDTLRVLPILGKGSLQNISDILALRGVDIGIVQSDVLAYAKREKLYPNVEQLIQYIAKLYDEEVHVLAAPGVPRLEDLAGKPVNVDVRGSGTAMTASILFDGIGIEPRHAPQDTALEQLRRGEIAALVYVAGKPARLFSNVPAETRLHFLPVPATPALLETYLPSTLAPTDYPTLVPGEPVETIAVGAVMAVLCLGAGHRAVPQGRPLRRCLLREIPHLPAAAAPPEMARGEPRGAGAGLDPVQPGGGAGHGGALRRLDRPGPTALHPADEHPRRR